jgi:acetyl-CoA C-acetyltransferase
MKSEIWLAGATRTPIGGFLGSLAEVGAPALGSIVIRESLGRAGVPADQVDEVILGNVVGAGLGQNIARQAAIGAGLPVFVGATTINKVCGSGMKAVMLAAQAIQCGDAQAVVAGGTENMSAAPYLLPKARGGYRLGHGELFDAVIRDGLWDVYNDLHMGAFGDRCAAKTEISRQEQDDFAVASYQRALQAQKDKLFADEIVSVEIKGRKGSVLVAEDEGPGRFQEDKLRALRPAFDPSGTITAGNASSINDGAAAIVVISPERARSLGVNPQARILGYATFSREPKWFTLAPISAIDNLLKKLGLAVADVDLFEVNEAFSVVTLAAMKQLNIPHERMNVHGGAVALGHPIGASGARILVTLLNALKQRQGRIGLAALCIGGGEAVAMAVERI